MAIHAGLAGRQDRLSPLPDDPPRIGLLTGPIGIGKTTVAERVVGQAMREGVICGGLLAPALKDSCGRKAGIWGVDVRSGARRILARTDRALGGPSMGPYSFDQEAIDWSVAVLEEALGRCQLLVVDEIGKLELWHGMGLAPILPRLAAGEVERALVLVRESLLADLQAKLEPGDPITFEVSAENREALAPRILVALMDESETQQKEIAKWQT